MKQHDKQQKKDDRSSEQIVKEARGRAVWVRWLDACGQSNWRDAKKTVEDLTPTMIDSLGFVLREDDKEIVIAAQIDNVDDVDHCMAIPKNRVTQIWEIR